MGIYRHFPYSNFHEMNMDEIIKIMLQMQDEWNDTKEEWGSYKEYIDNYFETLDLSEETYNALLRTIENGILNYVTPEMFGAKGDGETDDTIAIQAALDANCKAVLFGARKTYLVSTLSVTGTNEIALYGNGCIIKSETDGNVLTIDKDVTSTENNPIKGDDNGERGYAPFMDNFHFVARNSAKVIYIKRGYMATIQNCYIDLGSGYGIYHEGGYGMKYTNIEFNAYGRGGTAIFLNHGDSEIFNCNSADCKVFLESPQGGHLVSFCHAWLYTPSLYDGSTMFKFDGGVNAVILLSNNIFDTMQSFATFIRRCCAIITNTVWEVADTIIPASLNATLLKFASADTSDGVVFKNFEFTKPVGGSLKLSNIPAKDSLTRFSNIRCLNSTARADNDQYAWQDYQYINIPITYNTDNVDPDTSSIYARLYPSTGKVKIGGVVHVTNATSYMGSTSLFTIPQEYWNYSNTTRYTCWISQYANFSANRVAQPHQFVKGPEMNIDNPITDCYIAFNFEYDSINGTDVWRE